jgi:hypothetical protein
MSLSSQSPIRWCNLRIIKTKRRKGKLENNNYSILNIQTKKHIYESINKRTSNRLIIKTVRLRLRQAF